MSDYITVNLEAFQKVNSLVENSLTHPTSQIIKKYHKAVKLFYPKDTLKIRLEKYLLEVKTSGSPHPLKIHIFRLVYLSCGTA